MSKRLDFDWREFKGRDAEGTLCLEQVLVHAGGRVLAKVSCPCNSWEYAFHVFFFVAAAKKSAEADSDEGGTDVRFIDLESAKAYAEILLQDFQPATLARSREPISHVPMSKELAKQVG